MNDAQILDWLELHYSSFRENPTDDSNRRFTLEYIDGRGHSRAVDGANLRDCVLGARVGESRAVSE